MKSKPEYRRVKKYYKSAEKWRLERERRKRVLQLHEEGLSYSDIAERLGVSARTLKRDMAKIRPYYERKVRSKRRKLAELLSGKQDEDWRAEVEAALEGKSPVEQLKFITQKVDGMMAVHWVRLAMREYLRRQLTVTIDVDAVPHGPIKVKYKPEPPVSIKYPFTINLMMVTKGEKYRVGGLTLESGMATPFRR